MQSTRFWMRRIHKWLGLLIGLQVVLWLSGGLVMSLLPIEMVRGEHLVEQNNTPISAHLPGFTVPIARFADLDVSSVQAGLRLGQPVWFLQLTNQSRKVIDAGNGAELPELDAGQAAALARGAHLDHAEVLAATRLEQAAGEIRGAALPLWRVDLDDRWNSRIYIDAVSGRITAVRNDLWRFYDFFWMLHIMDYGAREDFNNNLLRSAAGVGWFIGLSGLWMLFYSFRRRDFGLK